MSCQDTNAAIHFDKLKYIFLGGIEMSLAGTILKAVLKAAFNNLGAKKTAEIVTSKPVREVGKKIIQHEIKKRIK